MATVGHKAGEGAGGGAGIREAERWQAAAAVEAAYLECLDEIGFADPQMRRERAIAKTQVGGPEAPRAKRILLAGIVELNLQLRALLQAVAEQVEILVYAPEEMRASFDAWGCVLPEAWAEAALPVEQIECVVAQGPADVARATFGVIGKLGAQGRGLRADQITLGVLDENLVGYLQTQAENLGDPEKVGKSGGIAVRYGAGVRIEQTRPYKLLELVAAFLETRQYRDLVALVRHPNLREWLRYCEETENSAPTRPVPPRDWLTLLDRYGENYLPDVLDESAETAAGWRGSEFDDPQSRADLAWLYRHVMEYVQGGPAALRMAARTPATQKGRGGRPVWQWAEPIAEFLLRGFGFRPWDPGQPEERVVVQSCLALRAALEELYEYPEPAGGGDDQVLITLAQAIRLVLRQAAGQGNLVEGSGAGETGGAAIEMIGWLELLPDDAEHLLIVGFNEGRVPQAFGADSFLNSRVRQALGLPDDAARYARDAYLFQALVAGRPPGSVHVIVGCVSAQGDPLLPSRLLFAYGSGEAGGGTDATRLARQVEALTDASRMSRPNLMERFGRGEGQTAQEEPRTNLPGGGGFGLFPLPPREQIRVLTQLRVTAFRDYLASPRLFYLKHVRRLEEVEAQTPRELAAMPVGSLMHRVLETFGKELVVQRQHGGADVSAERFAARLAVLLEQQVTSWYGRHPPASVQVQTRLLWPRLERFAEWQAAWMRDGWQPLHLEWSPPMSAEAGTGGVGGATDAAACALMVDGQPMTLRGKIDRIDQHRTGEIALLDYKLCPSEKTTPEAAHRRNRKGGLEAWKDLQLPLYRHVARVVIGAHPVKLGFIRLADKLDAVGLALADWTPEDLADADAAAAAVVRGIRQRNYEDLGKHPPTEGVFGYLLGQGYLAVGEAGGMAGGTPAAAADEESEGGGDE